MPPLISAMVVGSMMVAPTACDTLPVNINEGLISGIHCIRANSSASVRPWT
jgi:hypothetical protein